MGFLVDTSVLVRGDQGRIDLASEIARYGDEPCYISVITVSELLFGAHRATFDRVRERRLAFVGAISEVFPVLEIDLDCARLHAKLAADLSLAGQIIGPHDLWLAATCLSRDLGIATANVREFRRVPGLLVEEWG